MKHHSYPSTIRNHRSGHRVFHGSGNYRKALIAAAVALGIGMATTGTTYALWHASASIGGGTITAGNLALTTSRAPAYWDVSADRSDANQHINPLASSPLGHPVDLTQWRMVPGDKIALTQQVKVELDGDNLTAALALSGLNQAKNLPIKWSYTVADAQTGAEYGIGSIATTNPSVELAYFSATDHGDLDVNAVGLGGAAALEVVICAELPDTVTGTDYTQVNQALANLKLDLNQVRHGTGFNN